MNDEKNKNLKMVETNNRKCETQEKLKENDWKTKII